MPIDCLGVDGMYVAWTTKLHQYLQCPRCLLLCADQCHALLCSLDVIVWHLFCTADAHLVSDDTLASDARLACDRFHRGTLLLPLLLKPTLPIGSKAGLLPCVLIFDEVFPFVFFPLGSFFWGGSISCGTQLDLFFGLLLDLRRGRCPNGLGLFFGLRHLGLICLGPLGCLYRCGLLPCVFIFDEVFPLGFFPLGSFFWGGNISCGTQLDLLLGLLLDLRRGWCPNGLGLFFGLRHLLPCVFIFDGVFPLGFFPLGSFFWGGSISCGSQLDLLLGLLLDLRRGRCPNGLVFFVRASAPPAASCFALRENPPGPPLPWPTWMS
mmetsp:Transcript_42583/g.134271  ORF Transcript_42583/g.134271 Transcript_42583/m.134271 type:complete len:322 (-) Transcript_42583:114-1079(-)